MIYLTLNTKAFPKLQENTFKKPEVFKLYLHLFSGALHFYLAHIILKAKGRRRELLYAARMEFQSILTKKRPFLKCHDSLVL